MCHVLSQGEGRPCTHSAINSSVLISRVANAPRFLIVPVSRTSICVIPQNSMSAHQLTQSTRNAVTQRSSGRTLAAVAPLKRGGARELVSGVWSCSGRIHRHLVGLPGRDQQLVGVRGLPCAAARGKAQLQPRRQWKHKAKAVSYLRRISSRTLRSNTC